MTLTVEIEQEDDGRWIAEVLELPGVLAYGQTPEEAQAKVQALALRVIADRLDHAEAGPNRVSISFAAA
jgi:predicted RNase H-like HicB family nuclease